MKCPNPNCPEKDGQPTIDSFHDETQFYCNECGHEWRYDGKPLKPVVTTTVPVKVVAEPYDLQAFINGRLVTWRDSWTAERADQRIDPRAFLDECTDWLDLIEAADPADMLHVKDGIEWFSSCNRLGKQIYADGTYPEWREELLAVMIRIGKATMGIEFDLDETEGKIADDATGP